MNDALCSDALGISISRVACAPSGSAIGLSILKSVPTLADTLELGTWLHPDYFGRGFNKSIKFAMLETAFSTKDVARVLLITTTDNTRALAATRKLPYVRFDVTDQFADLANYRAFKIGKAVVISAIEQIDWQET